MCDNDRFWGGCRVTSTVCKWGLEEEDEEIQPTMSGGFLPSPDACGSAPLVLRAPRVPFPFQQSEELPTLVLQEIVWRFRAFHPRLPKLADVITRHDPNFIPKSRRWWRNELSKVNFQPLPKITNNILAIERLWENLIRSFNKWTSSNKCKWTKPSRCPFNCEINIQEFSRIWRTT